MIKLTPEIRALLTGFGRFSEEVDCSEREVQAAIDEIRAIAVTTESTSRALEVADDNKWAYRKGCYLFSFGPYGCAHVLAFGSLMGALEDAAATLKPGYFTEPEMPEGYEAMDEDAQDKTYNEATEDLTYTESGYLCSWEWGVREVTLDEAIAFAYEAA